MRSGSVQGPFRIRLGSIRASFGVRSGFVWGPLGICSGSVRGPKIFRRKPAAAKKTADAGGVQGWGRPLPTVDTGAIFVFLFLQVPVFFC